MEKRSKRFGIKLDNTPIFAVRREFNAYHWLIAKPDFREATEHSSTRRAPIETPMFVWLSSPSSFWTLLLQRAFSGVEAYVVGAAYWGAGRSRGLSEKLLTHLRNPFSLGGRSVTENYYNRVPALVSQNHALKHSDLPLWEDVNIAYREVRNPIFHGYDVDEHYGSMVLGVFDHVADLYRWIDSWCDPDEMIPGAAAALAPKPRGAV